MEQSEERRRWCCPNGQGHLQAGRRVWAGSGCSVAPSAACAPPQMCTEKPKACFCPKGDNIYMDEIMCVKRHTVNFQVLCELSVLLCMRHILFSHLRYWSHYGEIHVQSFSPLSFYPDIPSQLSWTNLYINIPHSLRSHFCIPLRYQEQESPQNSI